MGEGSRWLRTADGQHPGASPLTEGDAGFDPSAYDRAGGAQRLGACLLLYKGQEPREGVSSCK